MNTGVSMLAASVPIRGTIDSASIATSNMTVSNSHWPGNAVNSAHPCRSQSKALPAETVRLSPEKAGAGIGKVSMSVIRNAGVAQKVPISHIGTLMVGVPD